MGFLRDITHRCGEGSSKKLWYNLAALTATIIILWICYKDTMEDWPFIGLMMVYLCTVGGFEVILQLIDKIIVLKGGKNVANSVVEPTSTDS